MTAGDNAAVQPSALLTDWHQLGMLDAYCRLGMEQTAVFEFFVRRLPEHRNFLVAAGLEQVLDYLEGVHFARDELDWLAANGSFGEATLERLARFRFNGDVHAMAEGTVFFASEPILRVAAPLPEAQFVESRIINLLQYQTMIASKAARCRLAAPRTELIDLGMRRAHGAEAALLASRASYIAGFDSTSTVEAARRFGIPMAGTMAHSFVQAQELEAKALESFAACRPDNLVLLIDTYDVMKGARRAATLARRLRSRGVAVAGVRLDSGDLAADSALVRGILDREGCKDIRILVSGGIDEYHIRDMQAAHSPVDAYCVGTNLSVSHDAPALDCVYKLQQYAGRPCRKLSVRKETWPGTRQVYRQHDPSGRIAIDLLGCDDESFDGRPMLHEVMCNGRRKAPAPSLSSVRAYCARQIAEVPLILSTLAAVNCTPVKVSRRQHDLAAAVAAASH